MFSPSIPIFSDDIRYQIVAARAKRNQVIFNRFVRYLSVTIRPVMNLQLEAYTILIAQAAAIAIYCKAGFAFLSPGWRCDIRDIVHASPLKNKAPMSYLRLLLSRKWVVGRTSALYLRIKNHLLPRQEYYTTRCGRIGQGQVRSGMAVRGLVLSGPVWRGKVRSGTVRLVAVRCGGARRGCNHRLSRGKARHGAARWDCVGRGDARCGPARRGKFWCGSVRSGMVRHDGVG